MVTSVKIPKLGWDMKEGTLISWMVQDGATVSKGQSLYLLETDKVETEIESTADGVIHMSGVPGEVYCVGHVVAEIGSES